MTPITRALISVSDKTGIVEFAQTLVEAGVEILSTGGTAKLLAEKGLPVIEVADYTGFPEMLDGRVKTLHPKVHGGILGRRDLPEHVAKMAEHGIGNIDLVCVNLYPFEATIANPDCTLEDAIENIDIGGPTMVRSAAKNWAHVAIVTDSADYAALSEELRANAGKLSKATRFALAKKAFTHTAAYDGAISNYLTSLAEGEVTGAPQRVAFPNRLNLQLVKVQDMRYGENPHQAAAFYRDLDPAAGSIANYRQLQGKELSYNNIADADAAWEAVKTFDAPACVIVKHANPCGVAVAADPLSAYKLAFATDTTSAFGGIIAFNRTVDKAAAEAVVKQFVEVLMAPDFTAEALEIFKPKVNVRLMKIALPQGGKTNWEQGRNAIESKRPDMKPGTDSWPYITGQDAMEIAVANIAKDKQGETVFKDVNKLADAVYDMVVEIAEGKEVSGLNGKFNNNNIDVPSKLLDPQNITKDNLQDLVTANYITQDRFDELTK